MYLLELETEDVESKLNDENILRMHVLGLIASGLVRSKEDVTEFIEQTFFGYTINEDLDYKIDMIIEFLRDNEFIQKKNLKATKFGKRCSELYIDPMTALIFKNSIDRKWNIFGVLHMISSVPDMFMIRVSSKEMKDLVLKSIEYQDDFIVDVDEEHLFFDTLKTALLFMDWIDEKGRR